MMKMKCSPRIRKANRAGQGMTEYILIVALIAIAAIGIIGLFGDNLRGLFGASADALSGEEDVISKVTKGGDPLVQHKTLKAFATKNNPAGGGPSGGPSGGGGGGGGGGRTP